MEEGRGERDKEGTRWIGLQEIKEKMGE